VFRRPGTGWAGTRTEDERLTVADRAVGDGLGGSVGLDGSTIAAGASADDGDRGSARVFTSQAAGDLAPPAVSIALSPSAPDGDSGWYRSAVRVTVAASDPSGVSELRCSLDPSSVPASFAALPAGCGFAGAGAVVGTDGAHAVHAGARDTLGNQSTPTSTGFRVDRTPPTVTCLPAQTFVIGGSSGPVSATVTDGTSGPLSATVSAVGSTSSAGWRWAPLTGFDRAGNSTTVSCGYLVGYALDVDAGFPRRPPGVNAGSAVPLRFALTDAAGTPIADADALALAADCRVRILLDGIAPGCARYDATANRFEYVLKTPKTLTPGKHTVTIQVVFTGGTSSTDVPLVIRP
jgi:FG-GAP repeat protein